MIMTFDPGKPESKIYDESLGASVETFLTHFKGVRITSTDPLTIETYDDQFALDAENNVKDWYPNAYGPNAFQGGMFAWHDLTPAILAEADGKMAFSQDKSGAENIDYTSLISGPTLDVQLGYLDQSAADKYIPYAPTLSTYITADEAAARYSNLKAWYDAHKHLYIGTGPYFVDQVFPVEGTITVSRYDKYIFPADQFAGFGEPKLMIISVDGPTSVSAGEEATFDIAINLKEEPYPSSDIEKVSYLLFNTNGEIVATGDAENVGDGLYTVTLSPDAAAKLESGTAKLSVAAASKVVSLPVIETVEFVVTQ
jgi:peptide/nickel transport system substrate-binding protein